MFCVIIVIDKMTMISKNIRTLGEAGSSLLTNLSIQGKRLFTFQQAAKAYGNNGGSLRELLSKLVKRGWLQRIEKGKYLILPFEAGREGEWAEHEFIIASNLIEPYYIGFRSALSYYGYTEQTSRTVFVVSTNRKLKPTLEVSGVVYQFVCISKHKFFGTTEINLSGYPIIISEREKTIVDCLDRLEYCGGVAEVAKALFYGHGELDFAKIAKYAQKNGNKAVSQRLGYLIETLNLGTDDTIAILSEGLSNSYAQLDTLGNPKGKYLKRWKVIMNTPENELLQWRVP